MKKFLAQCVCALSCITILCGCQTSTFGGATKSDRSQFFIVSEAFMNKEASNQYSSLISNAGKAKKLNTNRNHTSRVKSIANRLIAQVGTFRPDAKKWKWQVNVIASSEVNAFCMPGGKIVVYTGIIDALKLTDPELAAVIGHEISHALREHSREKYSQEAAAIVPTLALGEVANQYIPGFGHTVAQNMKEILFSLPFSRVMETEADTMGMELMARAGFNPQAAPQVWRKMAARNGSSSFDILSTHPADTKRIENLEEHLPEVMPLYRQKARNSGKHTRSIKRG